MISQIPPELPRVIEPKNLNPLYGEETPRRPTTTLENRLCFTSVLRSVCFNSSKSIRFWNPMVHNPHKYKSGSRNILPIGVSGSWSSSSAGSCRDEFLSWSTSVPSATSTTTFSTAACVLRGGRLLSSEITPSSTLDACMIFETLIKVRW